MSENENETKQPQKPKTKASRLVSRAAAAAAAAAQAQNPEQKSPNLEVGAPSSVAEIDAALAATSLSDTPPETQAPRPTEYVSLIDEPFGIRTLEISEAQQETDELDLDEDFEEFDITPEVTESNTAPKTDANPVSNEEPLEPLSPLVLADSKESTEQMENLAQAMAQEEAKLTEQLLENHQEEAERNAQELAAQIAEDQALAAEMAHEQAEQEKLMETDPELLAALPKEPQPDENGTLDLSELQSCLESLLFICDRPVSVAKLQEWLGPDFKKEIFDEAIEGLRLRYQSTHHGIELLNISNGWQFRTKPGRAALAKKLAKVQTQRLSSGAMETLAIVAYRQPVLKEEVDKIRGVDSSYFVRGLLERKLIAISGRSELPGRPMLYSTTDHFLELFGLAALDAMPSLREIEQMIPSSQSANPQENEDPRVKEMRRLVGQMKADTSTTLKYDPREDERILREIRETVGAIPTSTPYLDEQKALEKQAQQAAKVQALAALEALPVGTQLGLENAQTSAISPEMVDIPPPIHLDAAESSTEQL